MSLASGEMVTDLLDFHLAGWHWPAFNLADSAAVLGATLLLEPERTRTTVSTEAFPEPVR